MSATSRAQDQAAHCSSQQGQYLPGHPDAQSPGHLATSHHLSQELSPFARRCLNGSRRKPVGRGCNPHKPASNSGQGPGSLLEEKGHGV